MTTGQQLDRLADAGRITGEHDNAVGPTGQGDFTGWNPRGEPEKPERKPQRDDDADHHGDPADAAQKCARRTGALAGEARARHCIET